MIDALSTLNTVLNTITSDNSEEFAQHVTVSQGLGAGFYFAKPYASWQRGTKENTNGLLRQFFPKQNDFNSITNEEIEHAMRLLNNRPRASFKQASRLCRLLAKCLGWLTPNEVFFNLQSVALRS